METKPAIYTTEFWLNAIAQVIFFLNTVHAWTYMNPKWSAGVQAIIMGAYLLSRGWAKSKGGFDPNNPANYTLIPTYKNVTDRNRTR